MLLVVMLLRYIKVWMCLCILTLEWFPCCCKFEQLQWDVMVGKEAYTCTHITFAPAIHNSACFGVTTGVRKPGPGGKAEITINSARVQLLLVVLFRWPDKL